MDKKRNAGGWPAGYVRGQKKGGGTPKLDDGLTNKQRYRLIKVNLYEEYLEWREEGKTFEEFQEMRAAREGNGRYLRQNAKKDGLTRGKRKYQWVKKISNQMVQDGVKMEDTPHGKKRAAEYEWQNSPKKCKMCPLICENVHERRKHMQRAHSWKIVQAAADLTPEDLENLQIIDNVMDGDLQFKAAHYMKISGSVVGQFIKYTGRGNVSSLTNALIDRPRFSTRATRHGIKWEKEAIRQYARIYNVANVVASNRNFPHPSFGHITATTDGLIGDDGLLEVKCPLDTIPEMFKKRRKNGSSFLEWCKLGDEEVLRLKRNDNYFYQCMLQLICSGRAYLDFVVAYRDNDMITKNEDDRWTLWSETILYTEAAWHWRFIEEKLATNYAHAASLITPPTKPGNK